MPAQGKPKTVESYADLLDPANQAVMQDYLYNRPKELERLRNEFFDGGQALADEAANLKSRVETLEAEKGSPS